MKNASFAILTIVLGLMLTSSMAYADAWTDVSSGLSVNNDKGVIIVHNGAIFLAGTNSTGCTVDKYDGSSWTQLGCSGLANLPDNMVSYGPNMYAVAPNSTGYPRVYNSSAGTSWTDTGLVTTSATIETINDIAVVGSDIWACGYYHNSGNLNATCWSYDGNSWVNQANWDNYGEVQNIIVPSSGPLAGHVIVEVQKPTQDGKEFQEYDGNSWSNVTSLPAHIGDVMGWENYGDTLWIKWDNNEDYSTELWEYNGTWTDHSSVIPNECDYYSSGRFFPIAYNGEFYLYCMNTSDPSHLETFQYYAAGAIFEKVAEHYNQPFYDDQNQHFYYVSSYLPKYMPSCAVLGGRIYCYDQYHDYDNGAENNYGIVEKYNAIKIIPPNPTTIFRDPTDAYELSWRGGAGASTDVYVEDVLGNRMGKLNIDFDSQTSNIDLSLGTFDIDATEGKSVLSVSNGALNSKVLYVKKIGLNTTAYYCPTATNLLGVIPSCSGASAFSDMVNLDGVNYFYKNNAGSGGGNGPLGGGSGSGCSGNISDPRCFNVTIGNASVHVYDTMCYDETNGKSTNVTLNAFDTMIVLCNATIEHDEGCQAYNGSLTGNILYGKFYDSTQSYSGCSSNDYKNCYINTSCAPTGTCSNIKNQTVECRFTVYYPANNTTWTGNINITDIHLTSANGTDTIPVDNLNALNVTNESINLGTLAPGANTSTHTKDTEIQNGGNIIIDLNLNGTSVFDCPTNPDIGIGNLTYDLTTGTAYGSGTALSTSATALSTFNLASAAGGSATPTATSKTLYWAMGMPMNIVGAQTCNATIRLAAIMDQ